MHNTRILQYLKQHGQSLDSEIAATVGIPLLDVRTALTSMIASGDIMGCNVTRFHDGEPVEGMLCRVAGFIPPASPGRKPTAKT